MSTKIRYCLLCHRHDRRTSRRGFIRISTVEREEKLREGYRRRSNGEEINQTILNEVVHRRCYNKIIQDIPSIDQSHSTVDLATNANEENQDGKHDQESDVQSRSTTVPSNGPKSVRERSKASCVICHSYAYTYTNRIRQVGSNLMANRLAQGYLHRYKRPYGKSLLDAYMHDTCYRKIYGSYRNQRLSKLRNEHHLPSRPQMVQPVEMSPHQTRSRSNLNQSDLTDNESTHASIIDLFSTPISISVVAAATINSNVEISARSCLFRPCIERLPPEQVEFYTKRNVLCEDTREENSVILDALPTPSISTIQRRFSFAAASADDPLIDPIPLDLSPSRPTFISPPRTVTTAEIRYLHSKPNDSHPIAHNPIITGRSEKYLIQLDKLYHWLIEQLKSSEYPVPISEALTKYHEFIAEEGFESNKGATLDRVRLRNRLEKLYPNEFVFVVPNKRDGTYIALNDLNHYVCSAIKKAHEDKDKATKTSMVSSIIVPPIPEDAKRKTCEAIMDGIRKIRLYIHDSKQIHCRPSHLMENFIGLITASDRQFDKISHNYDFYRIIDENLFEGGEEQNSKKLNRTIRNMSLASDLLSARHDYQISQKHYLLADEIAKDTFHCTPRQVITLLNRYGHTCSYRSYTRMRNIVQRTTKKLGEALLIDQEETSDIEMMDL